MVHVTGVSFAPGMTNEATELCSMTACGRVRECKELSAPGEVSEEVFSDGGSTPPASTTREPSEPCYDLSVGAVLRLGSPIINDARPP